MPVAVTRTDPARPAATRAGTGRVGAPATRGRRAVFKRGAEIIDAAAAVFSRLGYHGASTQDIADRLGIRQASLYYYFRSKEAALEIVCARGVEGFLERGQAIAQGPGGAPDKLRAIVREHLLPMLDRPDYVRVFMTQRRYLGEPARRRIARLAARYEKVVLGVVEAGIAAGEFRSDLPARDVMLLLIGACNAANHWQGVIAGMTIERATTVVCALLLDGLRAPAAGPAAP